MTRLRAALALTALVVLASALAGCGDDGSADRPEAAGNPMGIEEVLASEGHPHSLMVDPDDSQTVWLGVHGGLYRSDDGGRSWNHGGLAGEDAMNLAGTRGGPLWVAGHNVLVKSTDGGETFRAVSPEGLPSLDLHGFGVRIGHPQEIVAAVAGEGLYRSDDGARTFEQLSGDVGASVFGLSIAADGTIFAADPERGLLAAPDIGSRFTTRVPEAGLLSVAAHPERVGLVVAAGEPGVLVSTDGGRSFRSAFTDTPVVAVALDPASPQRLLALGADAVLRESADTGQTWQRVNGE